jgi:MFS transporter, PAT family, beta-lactamase induction signal transducer AmpG
MDTQTKITNWGEAFAVYAKPRVLGMIFLGFSAGLPFLLVYSTLSTWLRDEGVTRTTIGFFSWIGITYSIKVFWAPVVDRLPLPMLTNILGKRRSWMLIAQICITIGILGMAFTEPATQLRQIAIFALCVAFGSATQDIVIDAYRIEAVDKRLQGAMAATYVLGYRLALLVAGAGPLFIADAYSWQLAYIAMAILMGVGLVTTLVIREPEHVVNQATVKLEEKLEEMAGLTKRTNSFSGIYFWFIDAVISPFVDFFKRNGWLALIILLLIGSYRISDLTMGVMAQPFYLDKGFSLTEIGSIIKVFGFFMTMAGALLGGVLVMRYGLLRPLLLGAVLVLVTNLFFIFLVLTEPSKISLAIVISADNLSGGIASSAFIAYLSSLTNTAYTATQYALFSSFMTLPGKIIGGFSGMVVDSVGYASFFLYSGALGIPAVLLIIYLIMQQKDEDNKKAD